MSIVLHIVCWCPVGRLFLLRDRKLVSSGIFVWLAIVFLWWSGGKGCPSDLVLKSGGRSLLIRDRESVLWFLFGFGLFWCSFGGPEVARWWKLNDL